MLSSCKRHEATLFWYGCHMKGKTALCLDNTVQEKADANNTHDTQLHRQVPCCLD